ncbi:MAG: glycoside hydrolase family 95 protein [Sedimentisphaerales bacterium]|nr:glycoside hydrolase family 95 protein [Sedimentisphaerales bacterium]
MWKAGFGAWVILMMLISGGVVSCAKETSRGTAGKAVSANELLWYRYPAKDWNSQALHLGNGFMGVSFYGVVEREQFDITEETMWTGGPGENANYKYGIHKGASEHLDEIRQKIISGQPEVADQLLQQHFMGDYSNFGSFSTVGSLFIEMDGHQGNGEDYRRELDLSQALGKVSYTMNGVRYEREYFCSYPNRVLVARISSAKPGVVGCTLGFKVKQQKHTMIVGPDSLTVAGEIDGNGRKFQCVVKVLTEGGTIEASEKLLHVQGADTVTVLMTAATEYLPVPPEYRGADPIALTEGIIGKAAKKTYKQLKKTHINDYRELYGRVSLNLSDDGQASSAVEQLPTNERWQRFNEGQEDNGLMEIYFNFGRYLIISASRPGTLPSTIQGVWNPYERAPWNGNYQSNANLQMMYWSCGQNNLLECQEAYIDWIKALVVPGREVAQEHYGTKGWVSHTVGNIWGYTAPGAGVLWGMYPVGAAWHCQHLWEQYAFSQNKTYLRDEAYPVMKEAAEFWLANLVPFEGYLISAPTCSAEHGVEKVDGRYVDPTASSETGSGPGRVYALSIAGAYQDIEMIWDLFTNVMEAADVLGVDADFRRSVAEARAKLPPLKIGRYGQLQEWYEDIDSLKDHHRHIAHLYAVHPGREINPFTTPELAEAAKRSLNIRGDGRFPVFIYAGGSWARCWRFWCWARLLDGDRALKILSGIITEQGVENMMTFQHTPPNGKPIQFDVSMGLSGGITEMLLQSHLGEIHLLPALPKTWPAGSVTGLRARGDYLVDIFWRDGSLTNCLIRSLAGQTPTVRLQGQLIELEQDKRVKFEMAGAARQTDK